MPVRRFKKGTYNKVFKKRAAKKMARRKPLSFAARVKKVVLRTSQPKRREFSLGVTNFNHNSPGHYHLNASNLMPPQGTSDITRVGDEINVSYFRLRLVLANKEDRPNVNWKWWLVKVPKGSGYSYGTWFTATTNNALLDDISTDFVGVVKTGYLKISRNPSVGANADASRMITINISYKKKVKFGPADGAVTTNDPFDLHFLIVAYDTISTLTTSTIGSLQIYTDVNFKDP